MSAEKELLRLSDTAYFKERYLFNRYLGRGGFGIVFEGRLISMMDKPMAVKVVKCSAKKSSLDRYVRSEIGVHSKLAHPNIVEFFGVL